MTDPAQPALLVRTDTLALDRYWRRVIGVQVVLVVLLLVLVIGGTVLGPLATSTAGVAVPLLALVALLVPFGMSTAVVGVSVLTWRALRAIDVPIEVHGSGMVMRAPQG